MPFIFWGLLVVMTLAAVAVVVVPLGTGEFRYGRIRIAIGASLPVVATGVYMLTGDPGTVRSDDGMSGHSPRDVAGGSAGKPVASVASLLHGLEARLSREPNDAEGWLLLAKSYRHLGRLDDAAAAYRRARDLGRTDASFAPSPATLRGRVTFEPDAAARIEPTDTLFIFARESPGDRMPVAALRRPASRQPIDFELTEKEVMIPGARLEDYDRLLVTARVSRSGMATDVVEGLEARSGPVSTIDGDLIDLRIGGSPGLQGNADE